MKYKDVNDQNSFESNLTNLKSLILGYNLCDFVYEKY